MPRVSLFLIKNRRLRFWFRILADLAWVCGATVGFASCYDARSDVWMAFLTCERCEQSYLIALAFNRMCTRTLLKGIATTFQTALVLRHTTIMIGSLCALCYNQPAKLASFVFFLPSHVSRAFCALSSSTRTLRRAARAPLASSSRSA